MPLPGRRLTGPRSGAPSSRIHGRPPSAVGMVAIVGPTSLRWSPAHARTVTVVGEVPLSLVLGPERRDNSSYSVPTARSNPTPAAPFVRAHAHASAAEDADRPATPPPSEENGGIGPTDSPPHRGTWSLRPFDPQISDAQTRV